MFWDLIPKIIVLILIVAVLISAILYLFLILPVGSAKERLDGDAQAARQREAQLKQKIKEADAALQQRNQELDMMEKKIRRELEEEVDKHKEEVLQKARAEADEIINKAQHTKEQIRRDIEKAMELRIIDYAARITGDILSANVRNALDKHLTVEFIEKLKHVDMSRLGPDIKAADVISAVPLSESLLADIKKIFKEKLAREIKLNPKIDPTVIGGVILMFESLQLDGSLQNTLKESAIALKQQVEKQHTEY